MRSRLQDVLPYVAPIFSKCADNPTVITKVNEIQLRLLVMGKWVGTYQHYRFCVRSACITLPWQLETMELCAINNSPGVIRNEWFQFIKDGYGLLGSQPLDFRDEGSGWVTFDDVIGTGKKLRVYSDTPENSDAVIFLQFWNQNALPVRTLAAGEWIDGELVSISQTQTDTVNLCMAKSLVAVSKPVTNGNVFLYEYDTVTNAQRLIARYEPDEVEPDYRRYTIPFCDTSTPADLCSNQTVDIIAKKRFIPARKPKDILMIGHPGALKAGAIALRKEENNELENALGYWALARSILDEELMQFQGDGADDIVQTRDEIQNGAVENII